MAWPFGNSDRSNDKSDDLSEERLRIMASIAIEQVPMPEQGELSEEDAWTIAPGPTRAKLNSTGSIPTTAAPTAGGGSGPVQANVDTSGLERLISSRMDMVEDALRKFETTMEHATVVVQGQTVVQGEVTDLEAAEGDKIVTASGEVITATGVDRKMADDAAPLLELYEAQALASNPFLIAPEHLGEGGDGSVGAPAVAALLLDHLSGMAAVSFTQKAINSGMLSQDEGKAILSIVQMAAPGDTESALEDHLQNRELLTFSAMVSAWRRARSLRGE